jgi:hypothetical protein
VLESVQLACRCHLGKKAAGLQTTACNAVLCVDGVNHTKGSRYAAEHAASVLYVAHLWDWIPLIPCKVTGYRACSLIMTTSRVVEQL